MSGTQVNLTWDASYDQRGVTGYNVYRCILSSCSYQVTKPPNDRTYSAFNLTPGTQYRFIVSAYDAAGNISDPSEKWVTTPDTIAPSTPTNLSSTAASGSQVNLSWPAATDNIAVTGYAVEKCAGAGCGNFALHDNSSSTSYSVNGLSSVTTYRFRVRAYDAASNYGGYSPIASATTLDVTAPSVPTTLNATPASGTQISLTWSASTDNVGVTAYDIEHCQGASCSNWASLTSTASTSYTSGGLSPATTYRYRVRARDAVPNYGGYSPIATATTIDTIVPSTPTGFSASVASGTQINLIWSASSDNVGVNGYTVEWCAGAACSSWATWSSTSSTSMSVTGLTPATSYSFRVRAYDARPNYSGYSSTATGVTQDTVAPTAPSSLSGSAASPTQIILSWTASTDNVGVVEYHVERCTGSGCANFAEIGTSTTNSYSNSGLTDATTYRYRVRARDAFPNYSGYSGVVMTATPDGSVPTTPTGLAATVASATQINLTWNASTDNVGVTGYAVERCQGASCADFSQIATPTTNSFNDTTLSSGVTYRYRVRARDAVPNWGSYSSIVTGTTTDNVAPTAPASLAATPVLATQVNLTWAASTDNVAVVAYSVERCTGAACGDFVEIGTPTAASFNDTGRAPGTTYRYRVRARDAVPLYGGYSSIVNATTPTDNEAPTVPGGVTATVASTTQIDLAWSAATDNVAVTSYIVERCQGSSCSSFAQIATPSGTNYSDTGRAPTTTYRYQIKARDAVPNVSAASAIVEGMTPADTQAPSAPTGLGVSVVSPTQLNVSWTASTDNVAVTGYELQRCEGASCSSFATIATPTGTSYNDTGRTPNTAYRYQVRARDAVPNWSGYSSIASAATETDTTAPTTPANLRTTQVATTQINLAWDPSTDNVGVAGYKLERCQGVGCTTWSQIATPTGTTFIDTGRTQYTIYRYRVRANDAANLDSAYSSILNVTTLDGLAPTTPGGLALTVSPGQIALQWTASTDNVGVTAYLVERCNSASCTYSQIASVGSLSYVDSNLSSGINYSYRVSARDAQGNVSGYSTVGSALSADCD